MRPEEIMRPLNLPKVPLKLTRKEGVVYVWDAFRKKQLVLTPEEWVRQHILLAMVNHAEYPLHLISAEHALNINGLTRRCDGVVFKNGKPAMIVECKAPHIALDEKVMHQVAQYNFKLQVDYLLLTNGLQTIVCKINSKGQKLDYIQNIPKFSEL
ncbi:type I restriction enzyme HsdR N-terminal domain-containing protein [Lishizhenia sp.]|uniref:type I restriction enzyme HsdR N-terminal domain-containing protein n=1 Tax=Lishizhenia sp. TaxID=2497594 RepID=UPI00299E644F|nr:type I restriction enzyme HsdR N-terminal domain-containing protein [Lishizhenia sp.]MDX1444840.1 type I restriction enzyme HsdR N-terminal domain-containing protein [Lishizhenia sp.]